MPANAARTSSPPSRSSLLNPVVRETMDSLSCAYVDASLRQSH